jgi:hypothetical protein
VHHVRQRHTTRTTTGANATAPVFGYGGAEWLDNSEHVSARLSSWYSAIVPLHEYCVEMRNDNAGRSVNMAEDRLSEAQRDVLAAIRNGATRRQMIPLLRKIDNKGLVSSRAFYVQARRLQRGQHASMKAPLVDKWRDSPEGPLIEAPPFTVRRADVSRPYQRSLIRLWRTVLSRLEKTAPDAPLPDARRVKAAIRLQACSWDSTLRAAKVMTFGALATGAAFAIGAYVYQQVNLLWLVLLLPVHVLSLALDLKIINWLEPTGGRGRRGRWVASTLAPILLWLGLAYVVGGNTITQIASLPTPLSPRQAVTVISFVNSGIWTSMIIAAVVISLPVLAIEIGGGAKRPGRAGLAAASSLVLALQTLDDQARFSDARLRERAGAELSRAARRIARDYPDARSHLSRRDRAAAKRRVQGISDRLAQLSALIAFAGEDVRTSASRDAYLFLRAMLANDLSLLGETTGVSNEDHRGRRLGETLRMVVVAVVPGGLLYFAAKIGLFPDPLSVRWIAPMAVLWATYYIILAIDPTFAKKMAELIDLINQIRGR